MTFNPSDLIAITPEIAVTVLAMLVFIVRIGVHLTTFLSISENSVRMVLIRLGES